MSHHAEAGGDKGVLDPTPRLDVIACDGCGRCFATEDGAGMLAVLKGPCPDCGGHFELLDPPVHSGEL